MRSDHRGMDFWSASGAATLTARSPKKRGGGKRLSGNPQRREQQLASRNLTKTGRPDASSWARELSIEDRRSFADLARILAGWAPAMPWWGQSHDRVIKTFVDGPLPERPVDIETRACAVVGDEFYARLSSGDTGLAPTQWLRALVEETGSRLQAAIASGADDWRPLLAFLRGLAGIAPEHEASPDFPDIKFPRETAAACLAAAAKSLADCGLSAAAVPAPDEEDGWAPGEALVARTPTAAVSSSPSRSAAARLRGRAITGTRGMSIRAGWLPWWAPGRSPPRRMPLRSGATRSA